MPTKFVSNFRKFSYAGGLPPTALEGLRQMAYQHAKQTLSRSCVLHARAGLCWIHTNRNISSSSSPTTAYGERAAVIIPARMDSSRFPGKPLALIDGEPLILRTVKRAEQAELVDKVVVATNDERIRKAVTETGRTAILTGACASGTDRVCEAARQLHLSFGIVVNVQGDEPLVSPEHIDLTITHLRNTKGEKMVSLATPIREECAFLDPNVVKVVLNCAGYALLFSRAPLPYSSFSRIMQRTAHDYPGPLRHVGLYAFRREFLKEWEQQPVSALQELEDLEQMKVLAHGVPVKVLVVPYAAPDVNVPADIFAVEAWIRKQQ